MEYVIVTGTSRGIGFELCKLLAESGYKVLALSRNDLPIKELNNANIESFSFDISSVSDRLKLADFLEDNCKVIALINNAGKLVNKPFLETSEEEFKSVYDVNVFGVAAITRLVLPFMNKDGHVLTISSMGGIQGSAKFPGLSAYSSSKGAVLTLTELLAEEFKETGPSFNALALGAVQTEMLEEAFPGYKAPISANDMANYIMDFALKGHKMYNGKILQVSSSTP
ncbi:SDR family NAD(P)-dependent oxidoreductase [Maribacter hydrothermalis]|uniref:Short-chain dehydrogenase n=1 Tax=Maribacter hydrothermalis TaxID=1836467 RepID=A0A1B7ZDK9_9FLAO|nr:SDR family oxidoreductase [Maribacter hydrothermalis]APQ16664.1 short-chain dehydrogenase [Maribacter hydrothermalis]OBR41432.1 short-chain dehydrogenase [Maribacter hydrothermalis]